MTTNDNMSSSVQDVALLPWNVILMFPLAHELVPSHRLATPEERRAIRSVHALPVLRSNDVVAQYLGFRAGDVVRIDRPDGSVYWRQILTARG